jgi:hypothetical protein
MRRAFSDEGRLAQHHKPSFLNTHGEDAIRRPRVDVEQARNGRGQSDPGGLLSELEGVFEDEGAGSRIKLDEVDGAGVSAD